MKTIFLDIETVPTHEAIERNGLLDPQISFDEKEVIKRLSLSAVTARILCLGYAVEPPHDSSVEVLCGDEKEILQQFWKLVADIFLFVGHNILDFDLRFIYQRSVINRIKPSRGIPFARYRSAPVFDTMHEWTKWGRDSVGLDALAKALGLESPKANLDGSHVYDYHRVGRHPEIYEYCCRDVETVRRIYRRMTFTE